MLFTEGETAHKKSLGIQGNWTAVLEKIYWRCVFPMKHKLKQNGELKIIKEKANNFHSTIKFTSIHRWDVRDGDRFFGHKNVQWGSSLNKELILDVQIYYKPTRSPRANRRLSRTRVKHRAWRNGSLKKKRSGF